MLNLIGVLFAFAFIIFLVRKGKSFGLAMIIGSIIVGLFSYQYLPPLKMLNVFLNALSSEDTIALTIGVVFIGILANAMKETGEVEGLINGLKTKISSEGILAVIPAIFGLLAIPGGALMSAPYVDKEGGKRVNRHTKTFLNLWFRHIGFFIYPLSTSLVVISGLASVEFYQLILIHIPVFIIGILIGSFPLFKLRKKNASAKNRREIVPIDQIFINFLPIIVTIAIFLSLKYLSPFSLYLSLAFSIPFGIATSFLIVEEKKIKKTIKEGFSPHLAFSIIGLMIFYKMVKSSGLGDFISSHLSRSLLPIPLLIVMISFPIGLALGHNLGAVILSYSILESIISNISLPMASLLYISSFMGYLISPVHLCVVVSCEYFKPDIGKMYKLYIPSILLLLAIWTMLMSII